MNILYVTTIGGTMPFFKIFIKELIESGHCVDLACNTDLYPVPGYFKEWGCNIYNLSCTRKCFDFYNLKAIWEIERIIKNKKYSKKVGISELSYSSFCYVSAVNCKYS